MGYACILILSFKDLKQHTQNLNIYCSKFIVLITFLSDIKSSSSKQISINNEK